MAKRFHEIHHSRKESGMGVDSRMEHHDSMMISEDHSAIANLPQNVIIKDWADHAAYLPDILDDTIVGINKQINHDHKKRSENFEPKKV